MPKLILEIFDFIADIILFFVPHYVTDRVALVKDESGEWEVFCLESQVREDDEIFIDAYGTIRTITWLGLTKGGNVTLD